MAIQFNLEEKRTSNIFPCPPELFFLPSCVHSRQEKISAIGNCSLSIGFFFFLVYVQKLFK